jgi:hypothetical protein
MRIKKMNLPWRACRGTHIVDAEDNAIAFNVRKDHAAFIVSVVNVFEESELVQCEDCGVMQVFGIHKPECSEISKIEEK